MLQNYCALCSLVFASPLLVYVLFISFLLDIFFPRPARSIFFNDWDYDAIDATDTMIVSVYIINEQSLCSFPMGIHLM